MDIGALAISAERAGACFVPPTTNALRAPISCRIKIKMLQMYFQVLRINENHVWNMGNPADPPPGTEQTYALPVSWLSVITDDQASDSFSL